MQGRGHRFDSDILHLDRAIINDEADHFSEGPACRAGIKKAKTDGFSKKFERDEKMFD